MSETGADLERRAKKRAYHRAWKAANREKQSAYNRVYHAASRPAVQS